ncbi:MAG: serine/threonine protein kinase [Planctomycetes bacterium]|nr:serine/threonine protein kinase [Planctomycetota bacterium]
MGSKVPSRFGKWMLVKRIGVGASAIVYLAKHEQLGIQVALKVLRKGLSNRRPEYAKRFLREARTAARLEHPNIVRVIDCGIQNGFHYMVMDYVDGQDCKEMLEAREGGLDWRNATDIVQQTARGLAHASEKGIVHRDVKPSNIIIDKGGRARVTDLGLAKLSIEGAEELTQELHTVGTPNYMSPEQIRSPRHLDIRADIYSLGATYYHLVTGRPPYIGESPMDVISKHLTETLTPPSKVLPDLPATLSQVISKMMAKSPGRRYQTYDSLQEDLQNLLHGNRVAALDFRETYTATEEDANFLKLLDRLSEGAVFEIEEDERPGHTEGLKQEKANATTYIAPFDRSDMAIYAEPPEEKSTRLAALSESNESPVALVGILVMIGIIIIIAVLLLTFFPSH